MATPNLGLTLLDPGQSQKEVTINEDLSTLDTALVALVPANDGKVVGVDSDGFTTPLGLGLPLAIDAGDLTLGLPADDTKYLDGTGNWSIPPAGSPSGAAGGDLGGTYPNPTIAAGAVTDTKLASSYLYADGTRALTGNQSAGGHNITNVADPTSAQHAATKAYVDALVQGLQMHPPCRAATPFALPEYTYAANTFTGNANGEVLVDGVTVANGDRVLVMAEYDDLLTGRKAAYNGIYTFTDVGDGSHPYVLARAPDADTAAELSAGSAVFIEEGTTYGTNGFVMTSPDPIILNTTDIVFTKFTGVGEIIPGDGLEKTGNYLNLEVSGALSVSGGFLHVLAAGITDAMLEKSYLYADGTRSLTGDLDAGTNKITGLADPASAQDAATKAYVDGIARVTSVAMTVPGIMSVAGSPITSTGTLAVSLATQSANTIFSGPTTGSAATPTFRALVAADLPAVTTGHQGAAPTLPNDATQYLDGSGAWSTPPGATSGTVTSVAISVPSILSVSGSPITTTGTLAVTLATQSANTLLAGPTTGSAATPAFRALVGDDLPAASTGAKGAVPVLDNTATHFLNGTGGWTTPAGTGVTSVAITVPGIMSVSGSPITTTGTLAVTLATQSANTLLCGPTTGAAATPTFRALVAADLPLVIPTTVVTLTDAATVATDASLGSHYRVTLGGNRTLGNPTNPTNGQKAVWEIIQDGTGSRTLALDTNFAFGTDITSITLTTTASKRDFLGAIYNSTTGKWYVTSFLKGY